MPLRTIARCFRGSPACWPLRREDLLAEGDVNLLARPFGWRSARLRYSRCCTPAFARQRVGGLVEGIDGLGVAAGNAAIDGKRQEVMAWPNSRLLTSTSGSTATICPSRSARRVGAVPEHRLHDVAPLDAVKEGRVRAANTKAFQREASPASYGRTFTIRNHAKKPRLRFGCGEKDVVHPPQGNPAEGGSQTRFGVLEIHVVAEAGLGARLLDHRLAGIDLQGWK